MGETTTRETETQPPETTRALIPPLFFAAAEDTGGRFATGRPWVAYRRLWATDHRILVVAGLDALAALLGVGTGVLAREWATDPTSKYPNAFGLWSDPGGPLDADPTPIPDPGEAVMETCPACKGSGATAPCPVPHAGRISCSLCNDNDLVPSTKELAADPETGAFECPVCDGNATWEVTRSLRMGGKGGPSEGRHWLIGSPYARMLLDHGVTGLRLPTSRSEKIPARFAAPDGVVEGLVMGMAFETEDATR